MEELLAPKKASQSQQHPQWHPVLKQQWTPWQHASCSTRPCCCPSVPKKSSDLSALDEFAVDKTPDWTPCPAAGLTEDEGSCRGFA